MKKTSLLVLAMVLGLFMSLIITAATSYAMSQADEALIRQIDGRIYTFDVLEGTGGHALRIIAVGGKTFELTTRFSNGKELKMNPIEITGRKTMVRIGPSDSYQTTWVVYSTYTISDDGETITGQHHWNNGTVGAEDVYFRQK